MKLLSLGADPEVFVTTLSGEFVSSEGLVGGTKDLPREIEPGYCVQEDNILLEYNIPPCTSKLEFINAIHKGLAIGKSILPEGYTINVAASHVMDSKWLQTPHSQEFGCDPDYNAYTEDENPRPSSKTNLRTAGGHIHIAYDFVAIDTSLFLVKMCDLFLGLPSVLIDKDVDRRQLYGKAGAFRYKSYGLEYRSLSNFWLRTKDDTAFIYEQIVKMFNFVNNEGYRAIKQEDIDNVILAINTSNIRIANNLIKKFDII